jgi:tetratricopeptide (TPR) repeat protein
MALQKGKKGTLPVNLGFVVAVLLCLSYLYVFLRGNQYGTYRIYAIVICWLLYFVFADLFRNNRHIIKSILWIVVASVIAEFVLGFCQLFGWVDNRDANFRLGGSFGNPGAYSGYLAVVAPLMLSALLSYRRHKKAETLYYMLLICQVCILYMLFLSQSRGAALAYGLGCMLVVNYRYAVLQKIGAVLNTPLRKASAIAGCVLVLSVGGYLLYHLKADSAFGRVLVWKVTAVTPHDHWLPGNGTGYFEANYGKWQSAYFANSGSTEAERHVADYVTCAYNEFLELTLEQGIPAGLLFLLLFFSALKQKNNAGSLVTGAKASLASILVLMCVSYPLKITPIYLYLTFCFSVIFYSPTKRCIRLKTDKSSLKWGIVALGVVLVVAGLRNLHGYRQMQRGQQYVLANQVDKAIEVYAKTATVLKNNGIFHFYYGSALALQQQYKASADELEASVRTSSNPNSYILLAKSYTELAQNDAAKQAYLTAIHMIPAKLYPKYLLAKLLSDLSEHEEAVRWAKEILDTREKIPTTAAKEIKTEMKSLIHSIENKQLEK